MKAETRIYVVAGGGGKDRLIRATSRAQAVRHVAAGVFKVKVASQDDLIRILTAGGSTETAVDVSGTDQPLESAE